MVKRVSATLGLPLTSRVTWVAEPGTDLARLASIKASGRPEYAAGNVECGGWYDSQKPDTIHVILREGLDSATVAAIVAHGTKHRPSISRAERATGSPTKTTRTAGRPMLTIFKPA